MGILRQKLFKSAAIYLQCTLYNSILLISFLHLFTTENVVTLALQLTRSCCARFMILNFNCKDLHIHPDNPMFVMVFVPTYVYQNVRLAQPLEPQQNRRFSYNSKHFWGRLQFFWFLTNSLTDSGSPRWRLIIIHTQSIQRQKSLWQNKRTPTFLTCGWNLSILPVLTMKMVNVASGFISSPSGAPAPRNSLAQVTSCFLEHTLPSSSVHTSTTATSTSATHLASSSALLLGPGTMTPQKWPILLFWAHTSKCTLSTLVHRVLYIPAERTLY